MRAAWRGLGSRLRSWRFELHLALALLGSLGAVLAAWHVISAHVLRQQLMQRDAAHVAADARSIEAAYLATESDETVLREVEEVLATIRQRPGSLSVLLVDERGRIVAASERELVGGRSSNEAVQATLRTGSRFAGKESSPDDARQTGSRLEFVVPLRLDGRPYALEVDADGAALDQQIGEVRAAAVKVAGAGFVVAFALFYLLGGRSLSRRHRQVMRHATRDPLTDLGNHRAFLEATERAFAYAARRGERVAIALLDVDDFKYINDRNGHRHGDEVLIAIAKAIQSGRTEDQAFRIGGDEFAILLPGTDAAGAHRALERALATAQSGTRPASFTAGVATCAPGPGDEPGVVWEQADAALYEGKRAGGGTVVVFDDVAELLSVVTPAKVRALRALLDEPRLEVAFQPIWRLRDGAMLGLEALARPWSGYGFDGPADAFAVAEKIGRAAELDTICRSTALAHAGNLPADALLFLNVHPETLDFDALEGERLLRAVADAGLQPERVVLEVTERSYARISRVVAGAARLRAMGFRLALDDVGCGNSGLEMLRKLPVDFVKIDRSVVANSATDVSAQAVLVAIVAYARQSGAFVIAEGIESDEILAFLRSAHELDAARDFVIEGGQGYLLGRPTIADASAPPIPLAQR